MKMALLKTTCDSCGESAFIGLTTDSDESINLNFTILILVEEGYSLEDGEVVCPGCRGEG